MDFEKIFISLREVFTEYNRDVLGKTKWGYRKLCC